MAAPAAPPHADVKLSVRGAELPDEARAVCARLLPGWAALPLADIAVTVISGGITNSLLKARRLRARAQAQRARRARGGA